MEVGEGAEDLRPGDRVMTTLGHGGYAEEVVVAAARVVPVPEGMDFPSTAAFPVAYGSAHLALTHRVRLGEGEVLLVHGASGNVGRAAVEIGKRLGAAVIATGGSPESLRVAAERGADHMLDYAWEDVRDRVLEITTDRGADVVFDPVGGDAFDASLRCVVWEGMVFVVGFASRWVPEAPAWCVLLKNCAVAGVDWGGYLRREPEKVRASIAEAYWYGEGALRPEPSRAFPLERAAEALARGAGRAREISGKTVLVTNQDSPAGS